ncbi:MAG: hypothetical protein ACTSWR_07165 [Candidatus Helarchaeota archaeon]
MVESKTLMKNLNQIKLAIDIQDIKIKIDYFLSKIENLGDKFNKNLILRLIDKSIFNYNIIERFQTKILIDYLIGRLKKLENIELKELSQELIKRIPGYLIKIVKNCLDLSHIQIFQFIEDLDTDLEIRYNTYLEISSFFNDILNNIDKHPKFTNLERERIAKILADIHGIYLYKYSNSDKIKNFHLQFKENYEKLILTLQKQDLINDLSKLTTSNEIFNINLKMLENDYDKEFIVLSPLRLGLSSANASDNHTRAKEKGSKALNASINISMNFNDNPQIPIAVRARRLNEPQLIIKSIDLKEEFILDKLDDKNYQKFFKYIRNEDELKLLKQSLVHVGIIKRNSNDPLNDILKFTGNGGLELTTHVKVFKGTGLGTSSILSASLLMCLYRISNQIKNLKYPILYDQSILLEQSIGFNSGWQDARGVIGGKSAVKHFITKPTRDLPKPIMEFIEVDTKEFEERIILFYTGMKRFATANLNAVLDVYLSRDYRKYHAIQQSFITHDQMLQALKRGDYDEFGREATNYWNLRKIIDPTATNEKLDYLFSKLSRSNTISGALMTGAGGGGFAVIITKENKREKTIELLQNIKFENSFVANYNLNKEGIILKVK